MIYGRVWKWSAPPQNGYLKREHDYKPLDGFPGYHIFNAKTWDFTSFIEPQNWDLTLNRWTFI